MIFRTYGYPVFLGVLFSCIGCTPSYKGLRKLSYQEKFDRALRVEIPSEKVVYHDTHKKVIPASELHQFNRDSFATDEYVDQLDSVRICVVRKIKQRDIELRQRIGQVFEDSIALQILRIRRTVKDTAMQRGMIEVVQANAPIIPVKINCDSVTQILEQVLILDQDNRTKGGMNIMVDRQNQVTVVSIFENCGIPDAKIVGKESIYSMFMVIQHASRKLREKYIPVFKDQADKGVLDKGTLALMEDRLLMDQGKKQIYGTQLRMSSTASGYEVWPIEDPQNVDKHRAKVGLGPIKDYMEHFNVDWDAYLINLKH